MSQFNPDIIQIGISACLLGEKVRYDGGHKASQYCMQELSQVFSYVPVCPEMAIGLSTPRPTIRLVQEESGIRLLASDKSFDVTDAMQAFSEERVAALDYLSGYIVCAKSPSCGMERVRVYDGRTGYSSKSGVGLYTANLQRTYPYLPVEEDGRLHDLVLKENFITRVFANHAWKTLTHEGITRQSLVAFHTRYKFLLLAHHQAHYRELGRYVANFSDDIEQDAQQYYQLFMQALMHPATRKNHTNVLQHIQGFFSDRLTAKQKQELTDLIAKYNQGLLPLLVPITLIRHYLNEFDEEYIAQQVYLNPHPQALKLHYGY